MKAVRLHMLPGLTKGACSMFGANGAAVPGGEDGHLLQLRALGMSSSVSLPVPYFWLRGQSSFDLDGDKP